MLLLTHRQHFKMGSRKCLAVQAHRRALAGRAGWEQSQLLWKQLLLLFPVRKARQHSGETEQGDPLPDTGFGMLDHFRAGLQERKERCRFLSSGTGDVCVGNSSSELMFPRNSESCFRSAVLKHVPLPQHLPAG